MSAPTDATAASLLRPPGRAGIGLDRASGALVSLRGATGQELLGPLAREAPAFALRVASGPDTSRLITSAEASRVTVDVTEAPDWSGVIRYEDVGTPSLSATVRVRCPAEDLLSYWSISVESSDDLVVEQVHFPYVLVPYRSPRGVVRLVEPAGYGRLRTDPEPTHLLPDAAPAWDIHAGTMHFTHYPGTTFSQFLAWYDGSDGVYVGCQDSEGTPKIIRPVHHGSAIRLGIAHLVGWTGSGRRDLGYEVALGPFSGDWHDAADIYRRWWLAAHPGVRRLSDRPDLALWLQESPLHAVLRIRGEVDSGPAATHEEFTPYENALPLLDRLADDTGGPVQPVIMAWERPGPWVYPDSFPPAGGADSLRRFTTAARDRGWHVGSYCNGTQWVTGHDWTGYDGSDHFAKYGGAEAVCRDRAGSPVANLWDRGWRQSHPCCVLAERTQELAADFVDQLGELGLTWVQFLDQNCGGASFGCYSAEHGHPPAPGRWMSEAMADLLDDLDRVGGRHEIAFSVESAIADNLLDRFVGADLRPDYADGDIPLYAYLFHEYLITHATFAPAPPPHTALLRTAQAFVMGDQPGVILGPGGTVLDGVADPWPPWDSPVGDQTAVRSLLRRTLALRRGVGKPFLLFGRLRRDSAVSDVAEVVWAHADRLWRRPAVLAAAWTGPEGERATALANWTDVEQPVTVDASKPTAAHVQADRADAFTLPPAPRAQLRLPPFSAAVLIEERK